MRRHPSTERLGSAGRHGFLPPFGLILVALFGLFPALAAVDATEAEAAILPPGNPALNILPSSSNWLTATNTARADEGVGPSRRRPQPSTRSASPSRSS